jgi:uncharacterized protein with ParB-like and HNH nuclease domain
MKASETSLRNLLEGGKQFQIPLFQRPYSWKKENWETLWEDLMSLYNDEVKGFYFLGSIVTQAIPGTADGISPFIVIDGQQRLTTLTILLAALRNCLKKTDSSIAQEVEELYLINKFKKNDDVYKVLPTQDDREVYKSLIQSKKLKDIKKDGQVFDVYNFFDKKLKKPFSDVSISLDYVKFKKILLECLIFVNITSDENDNPYLIFESLNYKGEELTQADLVRNYIFMQLPSEDREEVYTNEWLPLQESFKENMEEKSYADALTNAFWFYLRKDGEAISQKEVYKAIKKRFDSYKKDNDKIKNELQNLIKFANYYQRLNFYQQEPEPKLKKWFERLMRLDFTTCHIFLLNVYHEYEENRLSLKQFEEILRYLESYFVRRLFAGVSTKSLGTVFNNLFKEVQKEKSDDLVEGLCKVLKSYEKSQIWPDNDSFRQGIISESVYSNRLSNRTKLILESLETSLSKEKVSPENLNIEHIMPQTLTSQWKGILGANYTTIHKKCLHTLGNLTLTGYNPELSNKSFADKKLLYQNSNVSLNKYFKDVETWNEETIKKRAEDLADIAIKVWPR